MNTSTLIRYWLGTGAAAMLAGCGGSRSPIGAPGAMPQTSAIATRADRGTSWMRPGTSSGDLIYVAAAGESYVLTYPQGKLVGTIDYGSADACSDSAGDVFLTVDQGVDEFSHGATTPSATLSVPGTSWGCAVDALSGNLAVTFFGKSGDDVAVFADAQGQPTLYDSGFGPWGESASYDDAGNLFVDGVSESGIGLAELPQGGGSFSSVSISPPIATHVGRLQWDGTYLTLESGVGLQRQPNLLTINRLSISDSIATVVSTTTSKNIRRDALWSWIYDNAIIVPFGRESRNVAYWKYPNGGKPEKILKAPAGKTAIIEAVTISVGS